MNSTSMALRCPVVPRAVAPAPAKRSAFAGKAVTAAAARPVVRLAARRAPTVCQVCSL